ncbi:hypothetical protein JTB14_015469 [Gonioctena quinquepunctata]|nr:hypothetical protein JTB14_015469 [Gonioctena quinquepunctata]
MTGVVKEQENLIKNMKPDKIKFESPSKTPKKQVSSPKVDKKAKFFEKLKQALTKPTDKKPMLTLRQRIKEAQKIFQNDPNSFKTYHEGYRKQVKRWPLNPLDVIIKNIKTMPKTYKVADFGCGDAKLAKSVTQEVFSFDLVAADETVIACDMSKVPLEDQSVDVVVFCLSLMGTNLHDYLLEANRVLKTGGIMKIAEVESRFEDVNTFIKGVQHFGFKNTWKDLSHNLFYFMDFKKNGIVKNKKKAPALSLLPCLYKKR